MNAPGTPGRKKKRRRRVSYTRAKGGGRTTGWESVELTEEDDLLSLPFVRVDLSGHSAHGGISEFCFKKLTSQNELNCGREGVTREC